MNIKILYIVLIREMWTLIYDTKHSDEQDVNVPYIAKLQKQIGKNWNLELIHNKMCSKGILKV